MIETGALRCKASDFVRQPYSRARANLTPLALERTVDKRDGLPHIVLLAHSFLHQLAGVQDGAVIASAKRLADFVERSLGQFAREIHRDLPRESDVGRAALAGHVGEAHIEMLGHAPLNLLDGDRAPRFLLQNILEQMLDHFLRQLFAAERSERGHAHERAFEPADIGADAIGEEFKDLIAQFDLQRRRLLAQNREARLDIRRLQFRGQTPLEARNEAMLEVGDFRGGPIAREDDLFMAVEERVEGVEEFFLRAFLAAEELDVVDQEQIGLAIAFAEFDQRAVLDRVDELVDENLARKVHDLRAFLLRPNVLADRLHQMRLAESDAAINEKRVVGFGRRLRHGEAGGMRDLVVRPDDERLESVARIESERAAGAFRVATCFRDGIFRHRRIRESHLLRRQRLRPATKISPRAVRRNVATIAACSAGM